MFRVIPERVALHGRAKLRPGQQGRDKKAEQRQAKRASGPTATSSKDALVPVKC